jgi:hypothetical protein
VNISRITLDLDRGIYQASLKRLDAQGFQKMLTDYEGRIEMEKDLEREDWFILRALEPSVSAREVAREYGFIELRDYVRDAREKIGRIRNK